MLSHHSIRRLYLSVNTLVNDQIEQDYACACHKLDSCTLSACMQALQEEPYLPFVKEMLALTKQYEKPHAVANASCKQLTKKPAAKGKAKAKAAAQ